MPGTPEVMLQGTMEETEADPWPERDPLAWKREKEFSPHPPSPQMSRHEFSWVTWPFSLQAHAQPMGQRKLWRKYPGLQHTEVTAFSSVSGFLLAWGAELWGDR